MSVFPIFIGGGCMCMEKIDTGKKKETASKIYNMYTNSLNMQLMTTQMTKENLKQNLIQPWLLGAVAHAELVRK